MAMNDFNIGFLAGLDGTKSKTKLNQDIDAIKKSLKELELKAKLDPNQVKTLENQLNTLKVNLTDVTISQNALNGLVNQINNALKGIQIPNINIGGSNGGNILGNNVAKLEEFRKSLSNIGMSSTDIDAVAQRIQNLDVQINSLNQSLSHTSGAKGDRKLLNIEVGGIDKFGQAVKLTQTWDMDLGQLVKDVDAVSSATQKVGENSSNFIDKQKKSVTDLTNQLNKIYKGAIDPNEAKAIKDATHLADLKKEYNDITNAISQMGSASKSAFSEEQNKVNTLIANLQIMVREYKNAETVATSLRSKDISTVKSQYSSKLDVLVDKMQSSGVYSSGFQKGTDSLKNILNNATDSSGLIQFLNGLDKLEAGFKRAKSSADAFNQSQRVGIKVSGLKSSISDLQRISPEIDKFEANINSAKVTVQSILTDLNNVNTNSDFSVVNDKWNAFTKAAKSAGIVITEIGTKSESIIDKISNKTYDKQFASLQQTYRNLGLSTDEINQKTKAVSKALDNLKKKDLNTLVQDEKAFTDALKKSQNEASILKTDLDKIYNPAKQTRLSNDILNWLSKNTAASKEAREQLQLYYSQLQNGRVSVANLEKIEQAWKKIDTEQRGLGKLGKNLKDQLSQAKDSFVQWISVSSAVMTLVYQMKKIPQEVYKIDTSMTNLYKVTDETQAKYEQFLDLSNSKAQKLGRSVSGLVDQTANWAKLGYNIDEASKLAETSSVYANVGEVDDETAVSDIITPMKAFNIEAENSIAIVDKLNKLGNEFATSSADLGEGLKNSSSAMALGGNSLEKTLALLTGGSEITQEAGELGNALKIGQMRVMGMKGALEELGEECDDIESVSKIQTHILNLTNGQVNIMDDANPTKFKEYYDILEDVAEVYESLDQTKRADLLETLFGKQRGNQGAALIQAFQSGQIQKALEAANNADGSAMQEQERWMQSAEAKTKQFEAAFQSLSQSILDSDLLKWFIDFGTGTVNVLDGVINTFGSLGTIAAGAGIYAGVKNIGKTYKCMVFEI